MPKRYELREALRVIERRQRLLALFDPSDLAAAQVPDGGETPDVLYMKLLASRLAALDGGDPLASRRPRGTPS